MGCSVLIGNQSQVVMRGLDPRIHAVADVTSGRCKGVDGRIKMVWGGRRGDGTIVAGKKAMEHANAAAQ